MELASIPGILKELKGTKIDSSVLDALKLVNEVVKELKPLVDFGERLAEDFGPFVVRLAEAKNGGLDLQTPLRQVSEKGITPASDVHAAILNKLNSMKVEELAELAKKLQ